MKGLLGKKNVMVMGGIGSGRYGFIRDFAARYNSEFSVYYFDIFKYLKIDKERLFGIIEGVFDDLGEDYVYIPNFIQAVEWIRTLKMDNVYTLLEDMAYKGKIITKVNKNRFDSKEFNISKRFNFYSISIPPVTIPQLYDIVNAQAHVYEKFYDIRISKDEIKQVIKEANFFDKTLSQPGKSLKRLMHLAFTKYGGSDILEHPKGKQNLLHDTRIEEYLKKKIIGQDRIIAQLGYDIGKTNFLDGGIVKTYLFQGEIGCGKLKTAIELSRELYGEDAIRYIDLSHYRSFPFKLKIYEVIDRIVESLYGGIIYLDTIDALDLGEIDILGYIRMKMKEIDFDGIVAPVIVIASTRENVADMEHYTYIIEHFDKVLYFNKLSIRDLERVTELQLEKVRDIIGKDKIFNAFVISANANPSLNALGVKKLITSMAIRL